MYDNDVTIETAFVRFELLKVDNTIYCRDYNMLCLFHFSILTNDKDHLSIIRDHLNFLR